MLFFKAAEILAKFDRCIFRVTCSTQCHTNIRVQLYDCMMSFYFYTDVPHPVCMYLSCVFTLSTCNVYLKRLLKCFKIVLKTYQVRMGRCIQINASLLDASSWTHLQPDALGFAQGFGCTIVQMCNIKTTNMVNELKVKTKESDKKIIEVKDTHILYFAMMSCYLLFFYKYIFFALASFFRCCARCVKRVIMNSQFHIHTSK